MKRATFVILISLLILLPVSAQKVEKGVSQDRSAKIKDIRRLMDITGSGNIGMQVMSNMIESYKKMLPNVPPSFWDGFVKEVDIDSLVEMIIPIYDKYLTHEEIKEIIKFYESPVGKKLIKVLPMITNESMEVGSKWGRDISNKLIEKLQKESEP